MDYIKFTDIDLAMRRLEEYYSVKYIDDSYIVFDKSLLKLSGMLNTYRLQEDVDVWELHKDINAFIGGKRNNRGDSYDTVGDLERTIPLIIAYESIKLMGDVGRLGDDSEYIQDLVLKSEIGFTLTRLDMFIKGNAYDYQYGEDTTIEDNVLYREYKALMEGLKEVEKLSIGVLSEELKDFSLKNNLDLDNRELNAMQVFFDIKTLDETNWLNSRDC